MTRQQLVVAATALGCLFIGSLASWYANVDAADPAPETGLAVVWTSADPDVAHRMVFMYLHNAQRRGWIHASRLIIWGPSARLLAGDKDLQAKVKEMCDDGVIAEACIACADSYGVTARLRELGVDVKPMGQPLSELILDGWHVLTF